MRIETQAQLSRTVQALAETHAAIERLQNPKRTSREEAAELIERLSEHVETLTGMIAAFNAGKLSQ